MMRRLSFSLAIVFAVELAFADTEIVNDITWTYNTLDDGTVQIGNGVSRSIPESTTGQVVVPSVLGGKQVTKLGKRSFSELPYVTSITIPEGVTSIEDRAFYACSRLQHLLLPSSILHIKEGAFMSCSELGSMVLPDRLMEVPDNAFMDCTSLISIVLPERIKRIGNNAFRGCASLTDINFPDNIEFIGGYAFYGATSLKSVTLPRKLNTIGRCVFSHVTFENVTILSTQLPQGQELWAFENCNVTGRLTFAEGITVSPFRLFIGTSFSPNELVIPSTISDSFSISNVRVTPHVAYIYGEARSELFSGIKPKKVFYEPLYSKEWDAVLDGMQIVHQAMGDTISVISTVSGGGTTSFQRRLALWDENISVTATPNDGYMFLGWSSDAKGIESAEATLTFRMPKQPVILVANFFPKAMIEGWIDTHINSRIDGELLLTAAQAEAKAQEIINLKIDTEELLTPEGAAAKTESTIMRKVESGELITKDSLHVMSMKEPIMAVKNNTVNVGIKLQVSKSPTGPWEDAEIDRVVPIARKGLCVTVPASGNVAFYRFVVPENQTMESAE